MPIWFFCAVAPSASSILSAVSPTFSTINVTWSQPDMPNGIIRGYRITFFPTANFSAMVAVNVSDSSLQHTITDLEAFTNYSITVAAFTVLIGPESATVTALTEESSKCWS